MAQIHTGPHSGLWLSELTFPDFGAYGKALELVRSSDEMKPWQAANAKVGNVSHEAGILLGIDL